MTFVDFLWEFATAQFLQPAAPDEHTRTHKQSTGRTTTTTQQQQNINKLEIEKSFSFYRLFDMYRIRNPGQYNVTKKLLKIDSFFFLFLIFSFFLISSHPSAAKSD